MFKSKLANLLHEPIPGMDDIDPEIRKRIVLMYWLQKITGILDVWTWFWDRRTEVIVQ
jgi:hypothetical protein